MIELSIVSGTYNRLSHLQQMIATARYSLPPGIGYELILVDGGSTDGTLDWLRSQPDVKLIEQGALYGAISAFNAGARSASGRYVLLANDDITFVGQSIARALVYMHEHPHCGIGAFYQDRDGRPWHVNDVGGFDIDGKKVRLKYGQVCIVPRWLGNHLDWWTCGGARSYGGDNCLSARCWETGFTVDAIDGAQIHDSTPDDELRAKNKPPERNGQTIGGMHPDSAEYYKLYPTGPRVARSPVQAQETKAPFRILYAPIYEPGHPVQRQQKRGLRRALQRIGLVWEVDYVHGEDLIAAVQTWRPNLLLTQLHDGTRFSAKDIEQLRGNSTYWANWNGDVYNNVADRAYLELLRHCDYHLVVNETAAQHFRSNHVNARYWQIGYEPDGVGVEPTKLTPRHDVLFMANNYSSLRKLLGEFLKELPFNVGLYGSGWGPRGSGSTLYDFKAGCQLIRAAKVVIGDSGWSDAKGFVSNRLFQSMAAGGAMLLHQEFDGMELIGLENGKHLVTWTGLDDLRMKIARYVNDRPTEREQIALAGQREVLVNHSFEARIRQLMYWLQIESPESRNPDYASFHTPLGQVVTRG